MDLNKWRKEHGITELELAVMARASVATVRAWQSGRNRITGPMLVLCEIWDDHPDLFDEALRAARKRIAEDCKRDGMSRTAYRKTSMWVDF